MDVLEISPPLMLGVTSLQLRFQLRISVAPKIPEAFRDLHRPIAGGEDLDADTNAAIGDPERVVDAVQILDPRSDGWRAVGGVNHFHRPAFR